jgi:hypothetical protein
LERAAEADMANVGHKPALARLLGDLALALGGDPEAGRTLLALAAWQCASEPVDTFWHERAARRLGGVDPVAHREAAEDPAVHRDPQREICDCGLVELLDRFSGRVRAGAGSGDLLAALALAAAEKQLDARRDLEGKTAWNFVVLSVLARRVAEDGQGAPERFAQAAALVNLFPTGEEEERVRPAAPRDPSTALGDAILDGEPAPAMGLALDLAAREGEAAVLRALAEAASDNDPGFNHSHQVLAVAAAADLLPHLPGHARTAVLAALAKSLANGQGSSDLGRQAEAALG